MPPYGIAQFYDQVYDNDPLKPLLPTSLDKMRSSNFNTDRFQSIFPTNVQTGIMTQAPLGFDTSFRVANEPDEEQVEFLGDRPNKFQEGLGKLFEFLQRFSPVANIARGIESIRNRFDTKRAIRDDIGRDPQGTLNTIISPKIMNIQPTAQDTARGDRGTTTSASKKSSSRQSRQTSGPGGLHSNY